MSKLIIANWKMNPQSLKEAEVVFKGILNIAKKNKKFDFVVCPPFPFIPIIKSIKIKNFSIGAQNFFEELEGSYTGEVSLKMLTSLNAKYAIVGHSERRKFGETDEEINKKILMALKMKVTPILCVGESTRDSNGDYFSSIKDQLRKGLLSVTPSQLKSIVIAYEPLWAIGKDSIRPASKEEFIEAKIFIKKTIFDIFGAKASNSMKIIYGGSVNAENANEFAVLADSDGLLIGRDSLSVAKFGAIINAIK